MTKELVNKVDAYNKEHMPWWDREEGSCEGMAAKVIIEDLDTYYGEWDTELRDELRIEAYREALKADPTFFDTADTGYCPDDMVEGWGDVYLCKGWRIKEIAETLGGGMDSDRYRGLDDDGYYLEDCTIEPSVLYKVSR